MTIVAVWLVIVVLSLILPTSEETRGCLRRLNIG
jgi:hypothetical protein